MKRLHRKVNIVVVIAKADSLTAPEIAKLKNNIINDIRQNDIQVNETFKSPFLLVYNSLTKIM